MTLTGKIGLHVVFGISTLLRELHVETDCCGDIVRFLVFSQRMLESTMCHD